MDKKASIFISYSHVDSAWKDFVVSHLRVAEIHGDLRLWDDRKIGAGANWKREIELELEQASVAVLLVSRHSLTSSFILEEEIAALLRRRAEGGLTIYPIVISDFAWDIVDWLSAMNLRPDDGRPLESFTESERNTVMKSIVREIVNSIPKAMEVSLAEDSSG